jgi:hypothetical protein
MQFLVLAVVAAALIFMVEKAHAHPPSDAGHRRQVKGKSGKTWFTDSGGADDVSVITNVFASENSDDLVLSFRQFTSGSDAGKRVITFQAPSALTADAIKDFI